MWGFLTKKWEVITIYLIFRGGESIYGGNFVFQIKGKFDDENFKIKRKYSL